MNNSIKSVAKLLVPIIGAIIFPIILFLLWFIIDMTLQNVFHIPEMRQDLVDFIGAFLGLGGIVIGLILSLIIVQKYFSIDEVNENNKPNNKVNYLSTLALIFANIIPLLGVVYLKWSVNQIIYSYWLESSVIGFYTILKINKILKFKGIRDNYPIYSIIGYLFFILAIGSILPFLDNHGDYVSRVAGLFSFSGGLVIPLIGFIVSHGLSYKMNFIDKLQYQSISANDQAIKPIYRLTAIGVSVLFGFFMYFIFNTALYTLLMLIFFKILIDCWLHINQFSFYKFWLLKF